MAKTRVLVIEDHPATAQGLRALLQGCDDLETVGIAHDGTTALQQAEVLHPDIVLLDLELPDQPGAAVARQLHAFDPAPGVLAYTAHSDAEHVRAALAADVAGYVLKSEPLTTVVAAVRAVAQGKPWYSPRVQGAVAAWLGGDTGLPPELAALTEREREVLRHVAQGASNREIATALEISVNTVARHVSHLLEKLACKSRVEAAVRAVKAGWTAWL
jgi:DNA-binding NarL/FixJ family response regulator